MDILCNDFGQLTSRDIDAPRYTRGLIIAASCTIASAVVILVWKLLYRLFDGGDSGVERKFEVASASESADLKV